MNNLGQKIKEQRIKKGLTQQEFAELNKKRTNPTRVCRIIICVR